MTDVFYTDEAAFDAALKSDGEQLTTFGFSADRSGGYSTASGFSQSGVNFVGKKQGGYSLGITKAGFYGKDYPVTSLQGPPPSSSYYGIQDGSTAIKLPDGSYALGLRLFTVHTDDSTGSYSDTVSLTASDDQGNSQTGTGVTASGRSYTSSPGSGFIGVISSAPIATAVLKGSTAEDFVDIAQVSYAKRSTPHLTITGTHATKDSREAVVHPFSGVTVADPSKGATDSLTITLKGGGGTLSGTGLSGGTNGVYSLAGTTPAKLTTELRALAFTPTAEPSGSRTTTFVLKDTSSSGKTVSNGATGVTDTPAPPTITGTHATKDSREAAVHPFSGVTVADPSKGATDGLTITLKGGGALSGAGLSGGQNGVYTLAGTTPANLTTELRGLAFEPAAAAAGSKATTTTFTLKDTSSVGTGVTNGGTSVTDTPAAATPTITGAKAGQTTTGQKPVDPFSKVTIADANSGATDRLSIMLKGGGTLSGTGLSGGHDGVYTLASTTPAKLTSELRALVFTPAAGTPGTKSTTTFTLTDTSSAGTHVSNASTSVTDTVPASSTPSRTADGIALDPDAAPVSHGPHVLSGTAGSHFVFTPGYGHDAIVGLEFGGPDSDTISLPSSDFASFAQVLRETRRTPNGALIHDDVSGDTLLLAGVAKTEIARHKADFSFHA